MSYYIKAVLFSFSCFTVIITCCFFCYKKGLNLPTNQTVEKTKLSIGINGHPLNQLAYTKMLLSTQFEILKKKKFKQYRFDVPIDYNGNIKNETTFFKMTTIAQQNKIDLLPMIYMIGLNFNDDETSSFNKGYLICGTFVKKYGAYINYYELGNEEDLLITKNGTSGSDPEDYDQDKLRVVAAFWKGMIAAIKHQKPDAKIIINTGGWFHYVFFDLLTKYNVAYDIIGYHWYSKMDEYAQSVHVNLLDILSKKFHKPIWLTEINQSNGSDLNTEGKQAAWIKAFINTCRGYPLVKAVFIYELLDEPDLPNVDESERHYGIIKWTTKSKSNLNDWRYKKAAQIFD